MSTEAMAWVIRRSPYTGSKYALHLMIADSANDAHDFELWARQKFFADKARISRQRTCQYMAEMIAEGTLAELENHSREGRPNRYRFLMPDLPAVFETRPQDSGGVTRRDTPPKAEDPPGGVTNGDTGVSPEGTPGVTNGDTGVSPTATQNPKGIPTDPKEEPNARDDEPAASDRARAASPKTPDASRQREDLDSARAKVEEDAANAGPTLFGPADSPADAGATPPDSAGPPRRSGPAGADDPDFVRFWAMAPSKGYPNHDRRQDAYPAWKTARKKATAGQLLAAWEEYTSEWATWPEDDRRYVPAERNWLARGLWEKPVQRRRRLVPVAQHEQEEQIRHEIDALQAAVEAGLVTKEKLFPGRRTA